jgi:hypothetical protein
MIATVEQLLQRKLNEPEYAGLLYGFGDIYVLAFACECMG